MARMAPRAALVAVAAVALAIATAPLPSHGARFADFELSSGFKTPLHFWDLETITREGACASFPDGCLKDLVGTNHMTRHGTNTAYTHSGCKAGGCQRIFSCNSWFESIGAFDSEVSGQRPRSLAAWFQVHAYGGDGDNVLPIVSWGSSNSGGGDCTSSAFSSTYISTSTGMYFVGCGNDAASSRTVALNTWAHTAATYDGNTMKLYLNGDVVVSASKTLNTRGAFTKFVLGVDSWWRTTAHPACAMSLDEVRVYDYALTEAEVEALMVIKKTTPNAPNNLEAISGDSSVILDWDEPTDNGGEAITKYIVKTVPGNTESDVSVPNTRVELSGLVNGQTYSFTVRAVNSLGEGAESDSTGNVIPQSGYGTHDADGGGWEKFWWYSSGGAWPAKYNDVLQDSFGTCANTDAYCFQRLPASAQEESTELLAVDSRGNIYKWVFQSTINTAHYAWLAFHDHTQRPAGFAHQGEWRPQVISGRGPGTTQDSFMYRTQNGVKSLLLDDDNCDCLSTLSMGHGMCGGGYSTSYGHGNNVFGVDYLDDHGCSGPHPSSYSLTLYFRTGRRMWFHTIQSHVNNNQFWFDASLWSSGTPFNEGSNINNNDNALYKHFTEKRVEKMRIAMNGRTYDWDMGSSFYGTHTLKELAQAGNRKLPGPFTGSWQGKTVDRWGVGPNGHERYYCHEMGFNYNHHGGCTGKARIGLVLSQEYGCGHPGTSEGIGLKEDCHNDKLSSGRLQWAGETNYWHAADLWVFAVNPECPEGNYRDTGSGECIKCPAGRYRSTKGGVGEDACTLCPEGYYGSGTGLTSATCSGVCLKGHWCGGGSTSSRQNKCAAGRYGSSTTLKNSECSGQCQAGYWCGEASESATANPCPAGRYGTAGQTQSQCSGPCEAGYTCPAASSSATKDECGEGKYCPPGSATAKTPDDGFFAAGGASSSTNTAQLPCTRGYFCTDGVRAACPAGKYGAAEEATDGDCTGNCRQGFYCPEGSTTATQASCTVDDTPDGSYYCPAGAEVPVAVAAGHYSTPEDQPLTQRYGQAACSAEYECTGGVRRLKIEWDSSAQCVDGKRSVVVEENDEEAIAATMTATVNVASADSLVYSLPSVTKANGCTVNNPFEVTSMGVVQLKSGQSMDAEACPVYTLVLKAAAGAIATTCEVSVLAGNVNEAPTMPATYAKTITEGAAVGTVLPGAIQASDPDLGQEITYTLAEVGCTPAEACGFFGIGSCSGQLVVVRPGLDYELKNEYTLAITASDNASPAPLEVTTTVTIEVTNVNEAPVFVDSDKWQLAVDENSGDGAVVGEIIAVDGDSSDTLTFSLPSNTDNSFEILTSQDGAEWVGTIRVKLGAAASPLNFEAKNFYTIEIMVADDATPSLSARHTATVRIRDVNDAPTADDVSVSIEENSAPGIAVGQPLLVRDEDAGSVFTYAIETGNDAGFFALDADTPQLRLVREGVDYESFPNPSAVDYYTLNIRVTDNGLAGANPKSTIVKIWVHVENVNERPLVASQALSIAENVAYGTRISPAIAASDPDNAVQPGLQPLTFSMVSGDASLFSIDSSTGEVTVIGDLDYEMRTEYELGVSVKDTPLGPYPALTSGAGSSTLDSGSYDSDLLYPDTEGSKSVHEYRSMRANAGVVSAGEQVQVWLKASTASGSGVGSGASQTLHVRNVVMVATSESETPETNTGDGYVAMHTMQVPADGTYTLFFEARISEGDDSFAYQVRSLSGDLLAQGTASTNLKDGAATPDANSYTEFKIEVPGVTAGHVGLYMRSQTAGGAEGSAADGQMMYTRNVGLASTSDTAQRTAVEFNGGQGYVLLSEVRARSSDTHFVYFDAYISAGNDWFAWQLTRGAIVTVNVLNVNEPPTVRADQRFYMLENFTYAMRVDGGSIECHDPDTGTAEGITYGYSAAGSDEWELLEGLWRPFVDIDPTLGTLTVTGTSPATQPPLDAETKPSLVVAVTCTDPQGLTSDPVPVVIDVHSVNEPPTLPENTYLVVAEATDPASGARKLGQLRGTDQDADDEVFMRFRLVAGSESRAECDGMFAVSLTGEVTLQKTALTFGAANCTFEAEVYEDREDEEVPLSSTGTVHVMFSDSNVYPSLDDATFLVPETSPGGMAIATLVATDPDTNPPDDSPPQTLTYTIKSVLRQTDPSGNTIKDTSGAFSLDEFTGELTLSEADGDTPPLDFERVAKYFITVQVEDDGPGPLFTTARITIDVEDEQEPPLLFASPTALDEDADIGTVAANLDGYDDDAADEGKLVYSLAPAVGDPAHPDLDPADFPFTVDASTGAVTVSAPLDYETHPTFVAVGTVEDTVGNTATVTLEIEIRNVNERVSVSDSAFTVSEAEGDGYVVGSVPHADPDAVNGAASTLTFNIGDGDVDARFDIDASTGVVSLVSAVDYEYRGGYVLNITVQDLGDKYSFDVWATMTITVTDVNDVSIAYFELADDGAEGFLDIDGTGESGSIDQESGAGGGPTASSLADGLRTRGGQFVDIVGENLGSHGPRREAEVAAGEETVVVATYGPASNRQQYTATCMVHTPFTRVRCTTAPGIGIDHEWFITLTTPDGVATSITAADESQHTSYRVPTIASVFPEDGSTSTTAGGQVITIVGDDFGPDDPASNKYAVTYGAEGSRFYDPTSLCAFATPHSVLRCLTVPGTGAGHRWRVSVGGQQSLWSSNRTAYTAPAVAMVDGAASAATEGGELVTVTGSNFGPGTVGKAVASWVVTASYGSDADAAAAWPWYASSCVVAVPHTALNCTTAPGVGANLRWIVHVGGQDSAMSPADVGVLSYAPPTILGVSGEGTVDAATTGGQRVVIDGLNLGPDPASSPLLSSAAAFGAWYGKAADEYTRFAASCTMTVPHTRMTCLTAVGTGYGYKWFVRTGFQDSVVYEPRFSGWETDDRRIGTSYAGPIISYFEAADVEDDPTAPRSVNDYDTRGSQTVFIHGRNYGVDSAAIDAVYYSMPASGLEPFQVDAASCRIEIDHELIQCSTVPGAGKNLEWKVVISGQVSTNPVTAYGPPEIHDVTGDAVDAMSTEGGETLTLHGLNFGPPEGEHMGPFVEEVKYGASGDEYTVAEWTVVDHTTIEITTVPGVGADLAFTVRVGSQLSAVSTSTASYAPPTISQVTPAVGGTTPPPSAGVVEITGANFGLLDPLSAAAIRLGNEADRTVVTVPILAPRADDPPTVVRFQQVAGVLPDRAIHVQVYPKANPAARVVSAPSTFSYRAPTLDYVEVSPFNAATDATLAASLGMSNDDLLGIRKLVLHGSDFGPPAASTGDVVAREVHIQPVSRQLEALGGFSVDNGTVASWDHNRIVVFSTVENGNVRVRVAGYDYTGMAGEYMAMDEGTLASHAVVAESGVRTFVDFSPSISALTGASSEGFATAGGDVLELQVQYLSSTRVLRVTLLDEGGVERNCTLLDDDDNELDSSDVDAVYAAIIEKDNVTPETVWTLRCRMPEGQGALNSVVVHRDGQRSGGQTLAYARPVVRSIGVRAVAGQPMQTTVLADEDGPSTFYAKTTGSSMVITGTNFGLCPEVELHTLIGFGVPGTVKFCGPDATPGATRSHSQLSFPVPAGEGTGRSVTRSSSGWLIRLDVGGQTPVDPASPSNAAATPSFFFRYMAPTVSSVTSSAGWPTVGGVTITVRGDNFGVTTPRVWVGDSGEGMHPLGRVPCDNVVRISHTELSCTLPAATGAGLHAFVTVADLSMDARPSQIADGNMFSYNVPAISGLVLTADEGVSTPTNALRGDTAGGFNITLFGSDLGRGNSSHCVFVTWTRAVGTPVCDGEESFPGEGEIPYDDVFEHDDGRLVFEMPAGMGSKTVSVSVRGQSPAETKAFTYDDPVLVDMTPAHGPTDGAEVITLTGSNFGDRAFAEVQHAVVMFHRTPCRFCDEGEACPCRILSHTHHEITFTTPAGIGVERDVHLSLVDSTPTFTASVETEPLKFSYDPPNIVAVSPNVPDALGRSLQIFGENFGPVAASAEWTDEEREVRVEIHSEDCTNAGRVGLDGQPVLECDLQNTVVGRKNVTVWVAGQRGHKPASALFFTQCYANFYGQTGEFCLPCPQGATCAGGEEEPVSIDGWYNLNSSREEGYCVAGREHRTYCNHVVPCEPKEACLAGNQCSVGYFSEPPMYRCSTCNPCYKPPDQPDAECKAYYKRAGECVECPDNPLLLVIMFIVMAAVLCTLGYILNSKQVHLAFLSIGVDYFQVLAIFARSRVKWPPLVKEIFHLMSLFNLSLEITAPECSIPDLSYVAKWLFIESLPLGALVVFTLLHVYLWVKKRIIMRQKKNANSHLSGFIAMSTVMFYFLYLYLTRTILDVFNCAPTDPPDGFSYLEVVFERCGEPGGIQETLVGPAVVALLVYTMGFPAFVGFTLLKNKELVMEDQLLRAKGTGDEKIGNPNCYEFRMRYHKMYYHFVPDKAWYWILSIILRKFFIAFTALMFNRNPAFQLSVALLVMFTSYALQVKHKPYMSMADRGKVLEEHQILAVGGGLHQRLAVRLAAAEKSGRKKTRTLGMTQAEIEKNRGRVSAFFFDYNTVEAILLGCAVLVNLSGIMFESNRLQSEFYADQRDAITYCVLIIIFFSITYFFTVFISEVVTTVCPKKAGKLSKDKGKANKRMTKALSNRGVEMAAVNPLQGGPVEMSMAEGNPMFAARMEAAKSKAGGGGGPDKEAVAAMLADLDDARAEVERLQAANRALRKEADDLKAAATVDKKGIKHHKKEFGATMVGIGAGGAAERAKPGQGRRHKDGTSARGGLGRGGKARRASSRPKKSPGTGPPAPPIAADAPPPPAPEASAPPASGGDKAKAADGKAEE